MVFESGKGLEQVLKERVMVPNMSKLFRFQREKSRWRNALIKIPTSKHSPLCYMTGLQNSVQVTKCVFIPNRIVNSRPLNAFGLLARSRLEKTANTTLLG